MDVGRVGNVLIFSEETDDDLDPVEERPTAAKKSHKGILRPGTLVIHMDDAMSMGMVVASGEDCPTLVAWSQAPSLWIRMTKHDVDKKALEKFLNNTW